MISGTADLSPCGRYRYELTRSWDRTRLELLVVMLNPGTADAADDDPTIRRVVRFADDNGWGSARVLNLYALRTPDPVDLWREDAVGPLNDERLLLWLSARRHPCVLAAWGCTRWAKARAGKVLAMRSSWMSLGTTKDGSPRHPLYVAASQQIVPFHGLAP